MPNSKNILKFSSLTQRGQGLLEYILLLVVVISLGFALLYQLFTPLQNWTQYYIGQYVECLLDQGELPGLGGENGVQDCSYSEVTGINSSVSLGGSSSNNSKPNTNNTNSENNESTNSENKNPALRPSPSNQTSQRGSDRNNAPYSTNRISLGQVDNQSTKEGTQNEELNSSSSRNSFSSNFQRRQNRIIRIRGLAGELAEEELNQKSKRNSERKKIKELEVNSDGNPEITNRAKKLKVDTSTKKDKPSETDYGSWSFSKYFRFLIILIVIIAILWFVVLQVAQITRSMEK